MMDILDPRRLGFLSLRQIRGSYDWAHANAVAYNDADDSISVSLRHQDAVVNFDRTTGDLNWIFGKS